MPRQTVPCANAEVAVDNEKIQRLYFDVHWPELRKLLPNVFAYKEDLAECLDTDALDDLMIFATALELDDEGNNLNSDQHREQVFGLLDKLHSDLQESTKAAPFTRFYRLLKDKNFEQAIKLLDSDESDKKHEFFRRLAELYARSLTGDQQQTAKGSIAVATPTVLEALEDFGALQEEDASAIEKSEQNKDAVLLSILTRKVNDWCEQYVLALVHSKLKDQLEQLLPGFAEFVEQKHGVSLDELGSKINTRNSKEEAKRIVSDAVNKFLVTNDASGQQAASSYTGVPQPDDVVKGAAATKTLGLEKLSIADLQPSDDAEEEKEEVTQVMQQMRAYQKELAEPGLNGKNCVIIAPTGSGKTRVSIEITLAKLRNRPQAKVVFLADRTQLVDQQYEAFQQQLPPEFKVNLLRGGSNERFPLKYSLDDYSVLILSTQILLNELLDKSGEGLAGNIAIFDLLIFDECHHCDKDHPAKKIMDFYFDYKEQHEKGERLPQIVGLTASPGTGNANRVTEAVDHVMKICANLDCHEIVTVRKALKSLEQHVRDPKSKVHTVTAKASEDVVQTEIEKVMDEADELLQALSKNSQEPIARAPAAKGTFVFTNFCGNLHRHVYKFKDEGSKTIYACWRYLKHLNSAHFVATLFRSTDAVRYIEAELLSENLIDREPTCEADRRLRESLRDSCERMREFCERWPVLAGSSPALDHLGQLLKEQFLRNDDSRVIVFVQQRCFTLPVKDFVEKSLPELAKRDVRTGIMTGANASGDVGGTTQNEQTDILRDFKRGVLKVLVSTSVSEEGLDVEKCNMVVRFCHVTNEIAMVQSKGRGRAEDSTYHVIVPPELINLSKKESANNMRDRMMKDAVEQISRMDSFDFRAKIARLQSEQHGLRQIREVRRQTTAPASPAATDRAYKLLCKRCNKLACFSRDLRKADTHFVVLCEDMVTEGRFRLSRNRACPENLFAAGMHCGSPQCAQKWGSLRKYKDLVFPMLEVKSFKFFRVDNDSPIGRNIKKWTDTTEFFTVGEVTHAELRSRAASLHDSAFTDLLGEACD